MKKTDRAKIISIGITFLAWIIFFTGNPHLASFTAVPALFVVGFTVHKSGSLFTWALFFAIFSLGVFTDYPIHTFPPTLVFLTLIGIGLKIRSWLYNKLFLYKGLLAEMFFVMASGVLFVISGIWVHYNWMQWISGGFPVLLYSGFSYIIYADRRDSVNRVAGIKIEIGSPAPGFALPDQNGGMVSLESILKDHHALLIFVRGDWCPTCHMMMRGYLKNKDVFAQKNIKVVGIGPDPVGVNRDIMNRLDEHSLMLSDEEQETAAKYASGLQENNPVTKTLYKNGIPLPASFLVHQNGRIIFTSRSDRPAEILQPDKIFEAIEKI